MTRSMRRRFRKILQISTLALLGATSGSGWLVPAALGQEPGSQHRPKNSHRLQHHLHHHRAGTYHKRPRPSQT